jgi:hypothetical protein
VISTTPNDGAHTDNLNKKQGTFRYRVSHPGGSPISNEVTVTAKMRPSSLLWRRTRPEAGRVAKERRERGRG